MELDALHQLLNLLRRSGVVYYKTDGLELSLAPLESAATSATAPSAPDAAQPDAYAQLLGGRSKFPGS